MKNKRQLNEELYLKGNYTGHGGSIRVRIDFPAIGINGKPSRSAVLKNPRLLFDKQIGKRLPI